jgi:hypothetical protein
LVFAYQFVVYFGMDDALEYIISTYGITGAAETELRQLYSDFRKFRDDVQANTQLNATQSMLFALVYITAPRQDSGWDYIRNLP